MNRGWRFHLGDVPFEKYMTHDELYLGTKTCSSRGAGRRDFDDSGWRQVNVPHDYIVEGTPTPEEPGSHGSLPRTNAWYRKTFKLSEDDRGKRIVIHFEGVCSSCVVHVNGQPMMRNFTAGIGFNVEITDIARYGEDVNVVAVYVDNSDFEGWYYEGGGIYRNVWLIKTAKTFVGLWGTFVISSPLNNDSWSSTIQTELENISDADSSLTLLSEIVDPSGRVAASVSTDVMLRARKKLTVEQQTTVDEVKVWDIESPNLYTLRSTLLRDGEIVDNYETSFGYRTIRYTVNDGFFLNGRKVFISGYGSHQDLTGFGVGITDSISEFRMQRFKSMGFNLFRTAHNPFAPAMYDACDRIGLMCMDENRWFNYNPEVADELIRMIKRDRNHPSIIMWSLFNEEVYRMSYIGNNIYRSLAAIAHEYDPTRPATGGDNVATAMPGQMDDIELIGINHVYNFDSLDAVRRNNPNTPIYFSEEHLSDEIRDYVRTRPYIFGAIGWGGLPYRGETKYPQLFNGRPGSFNQIFSLLCDPTDMFWRNKAVWTDIPTAKIVTHWTHPGKEGETITVMCYSNLAYAELFLNGRSLGRKEVDSFTCSVSWDVPYEPGELKLSAFSASGEELTDTVETVGKAAALGLRLENPGVRKNNRDTAIITAFLTDSKGRELPDAPELPVSFRVIQGGRILCVGSPCKWDHESWQGSQVRLFENKAQVYAECSDDTDELVLEAVCPGYDAAQIVIRKEPSSVIPEVQGEDCRFIGKWNISPPIAAKPLPDLDALNEAQNFDGWKYFEVGRGSADIFAGFVRPDPDESGEPLRVIFHAKSVVPSSYDDKKDLMLHFEKYEGAGKVVIYSGKKRFETVREKFSYGSFTVDASLLQPGETVDIWAVIESPNPINGICRPVRWMFR